ncbi:MAG TPA: hypothetical protein VHE81_22125 [Lacipirellulaceae bacterium]|nr:hypothetical protein [Lacipirellulaceae bacterium]
MRTPRKASHALNAVCPYFTMFPLEFPLRALRGADRSTARAFDPFCGRGTTNYAARCRGIASYGLDASPVAVAIANAKIAVTTQKQVLDLLEEILAAEFDVELPVGSFWTAAFHRSTLRQLCRLRTGLQGRRSDAAAVLRAVVIGCLHGPRSKRITHAGYFSNQMPRTFASKPDYSVRFWAAHELKPPKLDVRGPIKRKLERIFLSNPAVEFEKGWIRVGDSLQASSYDGVPEGLTHVITSPPYYGLVTYVEDQWLRNWFLGGSSTIEYGQRTRLSHRSPDDFARSLAIVWNHCGDKLASEGKMVVRFGSIGSRDREPRAIFRQSLEYSTHDWRICRTLAVGTAWRGKRQADAMGTQSKPTQEYEFTVRPA